MPDNDETYYEILRISRNASISEIVAAYHSARGAFSKDSIAMYSLFSQEEADKVLAKLEEAYLTLSNIEKKREYDRLLNGGIQPNRQMNIPAAVATTPKPLPSPDLSSSSIPSPSPFETPPVVVPFNREDATDPHLPQPELITGAFLRSIREKRSLSLEDVSRITKIPLKFLEAIEKEDVKALPAKVYVQGFIKNLSALYKLNPEQTARTFTSLIEMKKTGT